MPGEMPKFIARPRGFMSALARDVRGNTLAIMAAALIPLAGLVGGGIDISRMYITKTRLQHACDAGALAGRKAMGGGTWAQQRLPTPWRSNSSRRISRPAPMVGHVTKRLHREERARYGHRIGSRCR